MEHFNMFSCFSRINMPRAPVDDRHVRIQGLSKEDELKHLLGRYGRSRFQMDHVQRKTDKHIWCLGISKNHGLWIKQALSGGISFGSVLQADCNVSERSKLASQTPNSFGFTDPKFLWLSAEFTMTDSWAQKCLGTCTLSVSNCSFFNPNQSAYEIASKRNPHVECIGPSHDLGPHSLGLYIWDILRLYCIICHHKAIKQVGIKQISPIYHHISIWYSHPLRSAPFDHPNFHHLGSRLAAWMICCWTEVGSSVAPCHTLPGGRRCRSDETIWNQYISNININVYTKYIQKKASNYVYWLCYVFMFSISIFDLWDRDRSTKFRILAETLHVNMAEESMELTLLSSTLCLIHEICAVVSWDLNLCFFFFL